MTTTIDGAALLSPIHLFNHFQRVGISDWDSEMAWLKHDNPTMHNRLACWLCELSIYQVGEVYGSGEDIPNPEKWFVSCLAESEFAGRITSFPLFNTEDAAEAYAVEVLGLQDILRKRRH